MMFNLSKYATDRERDFASKVIRQHGLTKKTPEELARFFNIRPSEVFLAEWRIKEDGKTESCPTSAIRQINGRAFA